MESHRRVLGATLLSLGLLAAACGDREKTENPPMIPRPLPDSAFKVEWGTPDIPSTLRPGQSVVVKLVVKNVGNRTWPDLKTSDPLGNANSAVRMSHRWWDAEMKHPIGDWIDRAELPRPLPPGESVTLSTKVTAPAQPGSYNVQFDMVQELVSWFQEKGAAKLFVPVAVK